MTFTRKSLAVALLAAIAIPAAHAEIAIDVIGGSEVSFEGLVQADGNWFDNDLADLNGIGANGKDSEFQIRRSEIVLKGKGPGNYEWVIGYDPSATKTAVVQTGPTTTSSVNSNGKFLDVNIKYKLGGNSNNFIQVGQFKQPNSLEELSSTKNNDFIAKASGTNTFGLSRRLGAAIGFGDTDWTVTASAFGRELSRNLARGSGYGVRGTWAPINEGGQVLHLGLAYVDYDTPSDTLRIRARPDADLATARLVDSGNLVNTDRIGVGSFEAMYISGPFKVQGEYYRANVKRYTGQDYKPTSAYVQGLWNITGEKFGYKAGGPTTPLPDEPASGMWQLGLRYDTIDLNDGGVNPPVVAGGAPIIDGVLGGKMNTYTAGVNWYWRSNFKFAVNYVKVDTSKYSTALRGKVDDNPNIIEARAQFYW